MQQSGYFQNGNNCDYSQYVKERFVIISNSIDFEGIKLLPTFADRPAEVSHYFSGAPHYFRGLADNQTFAMVLCFVIVYGLSPVATGGVRHVYPFRACAVGLVEQLVEYSVVEDCLVQLAQVLYALYLQVSGFTILVLTGRFAAHGCIERGTAVAARDIDRRTESRAGGFEDIAAQGTQVVHHLWRGRVVYMPPLRRLTAAQFAQCKMLRQVHRSALRISLVLLTHISYRSIFPRDDCPQTHTHHAKRKERQGKDNTCLRKDIMHALHIIALYCLLPPPRRRCCTSAEGGGSCSR